MIEQSFSQEVVQKSKPPEVIANIPLDNIRMLYSIPIKNEWKNGYLLRNIRGILSQRIQQGRSIEVNYVVNMGSDLYDSATNRVNTKKALTDLKVASTYQEVVEETKFLKQIIAVQAKARLAKSHNAASERKKIALELRLLINQETDSLKRDILQQAADKSECIAISAVDASETDLKDFGYKGNDIGPFRTLGLDYARVRLVDKKSILMLYDCDTVPGTNQTTQEVIRLFDTNQSINYLFLKLGYQPPGFSKEFVRESPFYSLSRMTGYNLTDHKGSPQIAFRIGASDKLTEIYRYPIMGYRGNEDIDAGLRLMGFFGDMQQAALTQSDGMVMPISMTADRQGFFEGSEETRKTKIQESGFGHIKDLILPVVEEQRQMEERMRHLSTEDREKVFTQLSLSREKYHKHQQVQQRMNRGVALSLLQGIKEGIIQILPNETIQFDDNAVLERPFGRALLHFIKSNSALIVEMNQDDIALMEYYLGLRKDFPNQIASLTSFQSAMREYLGDVIDFDDINTQIDKIDDIARKWSVLSPVVGEILALGNVFDRFFMKKEFFERQQYPQKAEEYRDLEYGCHIAWTPHVPPISDLKEREEVMRTQHLSGVIPKEERDLSGRTRMEKMTDELLFRVNPALFYIRRLFK